MRKYYLEVLQEIIQLWGITSLVRHEEEVIMESQLRVLERSAGQQGKDVAKMKTDCPLRKTNCQI